MLAGGVNLIPEVPVADIVALAAVAEREGYRRCWVYDEGLATRDVYVTLAAIATGTDRISLGPGITNPYTRHPAQTAAAVASLDELSDGRAFLGIGAGGSLTLDPLGLERRSPLTAVAETIDACRNLFSTDPVTRSGRHVTLRQATIPWARPTTEIWFAGRGPKMLALGAATCDGVMLDFIHPSVLPAVVDSVRAAAAAASRPGRISYSTTVVTDEDDLEFLRPHMTYRLVDTQPEVRDRLGMTDADVERIRTAMGSGLQAAAEHVRDEWILPYVIAGTVQECGRQLADLMERYAIEEFLLPVFEMPDPERYITRVAEVLRAG